MKHLLMLVVSASLLLLHGCSFEQDTEDLVPNSKSSVNETSFKEDLAYRWAPIHYQDTDVTGSHGKNGRADYITAIDYDGDWSATNNWNNLTNYSLSAHVYYSVVETSTHWFIVYAFFHPRDWTDIWFLYHWDEHENDLEGYLSIIRKDGSAFGSIEGIITVSHSDFYSFVPSGSPFQSNEEDIDGTLSFQNYDGSAHPKTAQEAKGHGLKAYPYYKLNGDGIVYYPSRSKAEVPSNADDRNVKYKLVDIFESNGLWDQRFNTALFTSAAGTFKKSVGNGNANAPWKWDDGNDGPTYDGELATDPVNITNIYFNNLGNFSDTYTSNKYIGIE